MAKYRITVNGVQNTETGLTIPNAPGNTDWQDFQKWEAAGNSPEPEVSEVRLREAQWISIRAQRDRYLKETDHICSADLWEYMAESDKAAIKTYRQVLRDIPQNFTDPGLVVFPDKPEKVK